jgi:peptide/nickel transport system permease protein
LVCAFLLNFILPRLMPGDPVAVITQRVTQGMTSQAGIAKVYEEYANLFGTKKPMLEQFFLYIRNVSGRFWVPRSASIPDRLQTLSNLRSGGRWPAVPGDHRRLADWKYPRRAGGLSQGGFDKVLMPISIFVSNLPAFGMAVVLLVIFGIQLKWFPTSGGYGFDLIPSFSWNLSGL